MGYKMQSSPLFWDQIMVYVVDKAWAYSFTGYKIHEWASGPRVYFYPVKLYASALSYISHDKNNPKMYILWITTWHGLSRGPIFLGVIIFIISKWGALYIFWPQCPVIFSKLHNVWHCYLGICHIFTMGICHVFTDLMDPRPA